MKFTDIHASQTPVIMDGAMGTMLFRSMPEYSGCFELLNTENPEPLAEIHRMYLEAGASIIETNTFGGNPVKLAQYGLADRCMELNSAGAALAKKEASSFNALVGGSMGPTGLLIEPVGEVSCQQIYDGFAEQARGLEEGGADIIIAETMNDIQEARLALLAAKEATHLPVICSMTFDDRGHTMTGTDISTAFATLAACGADGLGANCGMGPAALAEIFRKNEDILFSLGVPLCVWANAGLPSVVNGKTVYSLTPEKFAEESTAFAEAGVRVIGGCCGTTPDHIRALRRMTENIVLPEKNTVRKFYITGRTKILDPDAGSFIYIGERLNPSARKKFREELLEGKQNFLREEALKQKEEGADLLDINVGVPGLDEPAAMEKSVRTLCSTVDLPLMIDSVNTEVLEKGLMMYPGIPVVNSIDGKESSMTGILPLIKKFGCFVVAMCSDETGTHMEAEKRISTGDRIVNRLISEGIDKSRIFVDAMVLAEGSMPGSSLETLKVVEHFAGRGIKTSLGISNVSYGLPERKHINNVFLSMCAEKGLSAAIVNTSSVHMYVTEEKLASDFLTLRDQNGSAYIKFFSSKKGPEKKAAAHADDIMTKIYTAVLHGNTDSIDELVSAGLKDGKNPGEIMDRGLLAALETVGEKYSTGEFFLPQMISAAKAMQKGFQILKPLLTGKGKSGAGRIIICTVKGDVHDIGKNIVAMMMENHGFEVFDLGKDVASEVIIQKAEELHPDIICLSSLLTTTMGEMKKTADLLKEKNMKIPLMVGGAVVNEDYAESIGAHYTDDAVACVEKAKKMLGGR